MKNILKKVSAFALALTLISGSTAIAKNINPKYDNTIVASAIQPVDYWTTRNSLNFYSASAWLKDGSYKYFSSYDYNNRNNIYKYRVLWGVRKGKSVNTCKVTKYLFTANGWQAVSTEYYDVSSFFSVTRA
jgi:hypothetical protein